MARRLHVFEQPARFVAGTIGRPGNRTFYLQARDGARLASVSLEKVQVAVLAERLAALLDELQRRGIVETRHATGMVSTAAAPEAPAADSPVTDPPASDSPVTDPPVADPPPTTSVAGAVSGGSGTPFDDHPLEEPLNEVFRAGTLALGWDGSDEVVVIEAREITDEDEDVDEGLEDAMAEASDDDPDGPDLFRVRLTAPDARRFVERAVRVVGAGRPPCPMCGQPLDPQGHLCPRRNGTYLN